ncbi:MAG: hypothetical protein APF76_11245 [Desulfitibacter sp. BRH_c19]|nr:MAG: hypothetical protein APF76_11245 [Desulfitibacter sp. BRH_c19]
MNLLTRKYALPFAVILSLLLALTFVGCSQNIFMVVDQGQGDQNQKEEVEEENEIDLEEQKRLEEERLKEERTQRELVLKEELGAFFVPLPPLELEENPPVKARGLYLTGNSVGQTDRFNKLMDLVTTTELNSLVIDVKNDHGVMSYKSEIEIVQEVGANRSVPIKDIKVAMEKIKERDIYPIARIVVFKDPHLAEQRAEWAIQRNGGGTWRDNKGVAWINPYEKKVWDYNIAIAKEAALMGFREIQFDYVRFPENAKRVDKEAYYPGEDGLAKDDAIKEFLEYAREQLEEYNVHIAADTFGVIATSWGDSDRIGQTWEKVAANVEYNCPMIYPSHYGPGYFGYPVPDAHPAGTVTRALTDAIKRNASLENPAIIRPWLQSFTASWIQGNIRYGAKEVRAQIDAALALGIDEYLIWNAGNSYISEAFLTEEEFQQRKKEFKDSLEEKGHDVLGRTIRTALDDYMEAVSKKKWREALVLHGTDFTISYNEYKPWMDSWTGKLVSYDIKPVSEEGKKAVFEIDIVVTIDKTEYKIEGQMFQVYKENNIWKVKPSKEFLALLTYKPEPEVELEQELEFEDQ